eukprot:7307851-Pyramimonas_sp.AAC.1
MGKTQTAKAKTECKDPRPGSTAIASTAARKVTSGQTADHDSEEMQQRSKSDQWKTNQRRRPSRR